jgi:hypothetical protein
VSHLAVDPVPASAGQVLSVLSLAVLVRLVNGGALVHRQYLSSAVQVLARALF